jgi:hypothetical protein
MAAGSQPGTVMPAVLAAMAWKHCSWTERAKNEALYSLLPQVVGLALVGVLQEGQVRRDDGVRDGLGGGVELGVQPHDGQGLQGRAVGLVGPVPRRSVDQE